MSTIINVMKIRIQDFGPIRDFTFDLDKDLHLLYGKNGTGKSYAVYCVYMILKELFTDWGQRFLVREALALAINGGSSHLKKVSDEIVEKIKDNQKRKIRVNKEVTDILKCVIAENATIIQDSILSMYGTLNNLDNKLAHDCFKLTVETDDFMLCLNHQKGKISVSEFDLRKPVEIIYEGENTLSYSLDGLPSLITIVYPTLESANLSDFVKEICNKLIYSLIADNDLYNISLYFLPASRSGLYQGLSSLSPIIAELSKQRHLTKKKLELPALSEPVADYFLALSSIDNLEENKTLEKITQDIEASVLNGKVSYSTSDKKIFFNPKDTALKLDLSQSSSMVAELSPMVTYLRYVIRDRIGFTEKHVVPSYYEILFIEEPEAHLHPEAQVKLMEILAELPKHNIKVVMTSHSNYMFNKLTNLILEKKVNPDKVATYHMVMTDKGSIVQDDMPVTDEGIEDSNFLTVAEQLYEERMQLLDETTE